MASIGNKVYLYGGASSIYSDAWVLHSLRGEDAPPGHTRMGHFLLVVPLC